MGLTTPVVCLSQPPSLTHLPVCFLVLQACTSALCSGYRSQQLQSKHCSSTSQVRACSEIVHGVITHAHCFELRVKLSLVVCLPRYWNPNRMQLHRLSRSLSAAWHPQAGRNGECTLALLVMFVHVCLPVHHSFLDMHRWLRITSPCFRSTSKAMVSATANGCTSTSRYDSLLREHDWRVQISLRVMR